MADTDTAAHSSNPISPSSEPIPHPDFCPGSRVQEEEVPPAPMSHPCSLGSEKAHQSESLLCRNLMGLHNPIPTATEESLKDAEEVAVVSWC